MNIKQAIKSSPRVTSLLSLPLSIRRRYLQGRYWSAFEAMKRLGEIADADLTVQVGEFKGRFNISPRSALLHRLLVYGEYEPKVSSLFFKHVSPDSDVIDVGANVGFYSIGSASLLSSGRVLAIEPTSAAFNRLKANAKLNGVDNRIIAERTLVSDSEGIFEINIIQGQEEYSSLGKFVHPSAAAELSASERVRSTSVDRLVKKYNLRPSIMKVDVEGSEYGVLNGALETIRSFRPFIMTECSDEMLRQQGASSYKLVELISSLDYDIVNPEAPSTPVKRYHSGDIFCLPRIN